MFELNNSHAVPAESDDLKSKASNHLTDLMPVSFPQDSLAGDVIENIVQNIPSNFLDTAQVTTPDIRFLDQEPSLVQVPEVQLQLSPENETAEFQLSDSVTSVDMQDLAKLATDQVASAAPQQVLTLNQDEARLLLSVPSLQDPMEFQARDQQLKFEPPSPAASETYSTTSAVSVVYPAESSTAGKMPKGKRRALEKDSEEYRLRRERNNVAVRKSRNKAKQRQEQIDQKNNVLETENHSLKQKLDAMQRELELLKGLYESAGLELPSNFSEVSTL